MEKIFFGAVRGYFRQVYGLKLHFRQVYGLCLVTIDVAPFAFFKELRFPRGNFMV